TIVSMFSHMSFIIFCTSLLKSSQSTASSFRAMKLSKLLAPPKMTLRMVSLLKFFIVGRTLLTLHDTSCHICRIKSARSEEVDSCARRSSTLDSFALAGESPDDFKGSRIASGSFRTNDSSRYGSVERRRDSCNCSAWSGWWMVLARRLSHQSHWSQ